MKTLHQISRDRAGFAGQGAFTPFRIGFTILAEASNNIDAVIQLLDAHGAPIKAIVPFFVYVGVDVAGDFTLGAAATGLNVTGGVGNRFCLLVSNLIAGFVTNASGLANIRTTVVGASSRRLVVLLPGGTLQQSGSLVWT